MANGNFISGYEARPRNLRRALTLVGVFSLAARGGSSKSDAIPADTQPPVAATIAEPKGIETTATTVNHVLVFDSLGSTAFSIIQVYPGPKPIPEDRQYNGTFNDGDRVPAECKTTGRTVNSDPTAGEVERHSDQWVRIIGSPGKTQFATSVYIENPDALLAQLPQC